MEVLGSGACFVSRWILTLILYWLKKKNNNKQGCYRGNLCVRLFSQVRWQGCQPHLWSFILPETSNWRHLGEIRASGKADTQGQVHVEYVAQLQGGLVSRGHCSMVWSELAPGAVFVPLCPAIEEDLNGKPLSFWHKQCVLLSDHSSVLCFSVQPSSEPTTGVPRHV